MLKTLLSAVLGSPHDRYVKRLRPVLAQIHEHEARLQALSHAEIQAQTAKFRTLIEERTRIQRAELEALKAAKHANPDPAERVSLDDRIAALEEEQRALHAQMENPAFWNGPQQAIATAQARLAVVPDELAAAYARWSALHG